MKNTPDPFLGVGYVTARAPFGRDEAFVQEEIRALVCRGHRVRIVPLLPRGWLVHGLARDLRLATDARQPWSPDVLAAALSQLLRHPWRCLQALALLLTWKPRPLLANLFVYPKALWLARRARALGLQHLHAHWATTTAAMTMAAAHVARLPWSFTAHGYDLLANDLFARKARHAAFYRVISRHGLQLATQQCGAPPDKAVLLHMGVHVPETLPPPQGRRHGPLRLLCPARLAPEKDHRRLLEAFARVQAPAELCLAGDGPERAAIESLIAARGLQNVRLLGPLRHEVLLDLYRRRLVDAVVLSSTREGIPVALMEAMAAGVPVIATAAGGVPELLAAGAGMVVPVGDTDTLAWAMETLLRDAGMRARLARAGRARVARRFTIERAAEKLEALFAAHAHGAVDSLSPAGTRSRTSARYAPAYATTNRPTHATSTSASSHHNAAGSTVPSTSGAA